MPVCMLTHLCSPEDWLMDTSKNIEDHSEVRANQDVVAHGSASANTVPDHADLERARLQTVLELLNGRLDLQASRHPA